MADVREVFPTLEDGSNVGAALSKSQAGDAATGKVGSTAFAFRDSTGNLVLPQLNGSGQIPVSLAAAGTCLSAYAENTSGSLTEAALATITLTANESYAEIEAFVACTRATKFLIIQHDNGANTTLGTILVGPGQFSVKYQVDCQEFTAGGTGTQELRLRYINLDKASSVYGTLAVMQKP